MQNENNSISSNEWGHGNAETTVNEIVLNLNNETVLPTKRLSNKKNIVTHFLMKFVIFNAQDFSNF
jgi:hypothetical protein